MISRHGVRVSARLLILGTFVPVERSINQFVNSLISVISDVFCKIVAGELPADKVYEDEEFLVIKDIHPQAPVHLLIFPKKHVFGMHDATEEILGRAMIIADKVAQQLGIHEKGYRLILNEGDHGGKLVPHLHVHLLGGKALGAKIVRE